MSLKPVLVQLDEDLWKHAKIRASVLGVTASQFTEQALGNHLLATAKQDAKKITSLTMRTSNYVSSLTADAPSNRSKR